ncbi:hypothetical protein [Gemmatimonas sp.]|uniref:hypothetical protein n=1 Tax=Gemmatimonas sp. TaxID=1962908 RepID=UPI003F70EB2C
MNISILAVTVALVAAAVSAGSHVPSPPKALPRAIVAQAGACQWGSTTVNSVRDLFVTIVTADDDDDAADSARFHLNLPATIEDSVVKVTNAAVCDRALTAYRIQKFGADTGWLNKVAVFRIYDRYGVYGGELTPRGPIVFTFDLSWTYKGRF